ncbi:hypothetical protein X946_5522 [Burkholderia sp. ABCPW 111]|nr:hypothetical protein X946_5522 [Burkholderia sp. ABCPW 111]
MPLVGVDRRFDLAIHRGINTHEGGVLCKRKRLGDWRWSEHGGQISRELVATCSIGSVIKLRTSKGRDCLRGVGIGCSRSSRHRPGCLHQGSECDCVTLPSHPAGIIDGSSNRVKIGQQFARRARTQGPRKSQNQQILPALRKFPRCSGIGRPDRRQNAIDAYGATSVTVVRVADGFSHQYRLVRGIDRESRYRRSTAGLRLNLYDPSRWLTRYRLRVRPKTGRRARRVRESKGLGPAALH